MYLYGELLVRWDFNACHYPNLCTILVREGGRQNKAWGEARREPQESIRGNYQAHEVGDRPWQIVDYALSPAYAGWMFFRQYSQGSARNALHPGLYAVARLRGLKTKSHVPCKDLGNDKDFNAASYSQNNLRYTQRELTVHATEEKPHEP